MKKKLKNNSFLIPSFLAGVTGLSYEKTVHNKPKLVKIDENGNYIFQCTEFLGKLYFGQFLDNVEILEPENLRTYFKEKSQKMYNLYNKKNKE